MCSVVVGVYYCRSVVVVVYSCTIIACSVIGSVWQVLYTVCVQVCGGSAPLQAQECYKAELLNCEFYMLEYWCQHSQECHSRHRNATRQNFSTVGGRNIVLCVSVMSHGWCVVCRCMCHASCVMYHVLLVICHVSFIMLHVSCAKCHVSCVMWQLTCASSHVSGSMCHMSGSRYSSLSCSYSHV